MNGQIVLTVSATGGNQGILSGFQLVTGSRVEADTPVFSPDDMIISGPKDITITSSTSGASIYYTTNGNEPTTNSTLYTGPVTVTGGTTLKAIAVAGGLVSRTTSETFNLQTIPTVAWHGLSTSNCSISRLQELKNAGFTHNLYPNESFSNVGYAQDALDNAKAAGIKMFVTVTSSMTPASLAYLCENHPAVEGYWVADEPNVSQFSSLAMQVQTIQSLDANHWCYINLFPDGCSSSQLGASTYTDYVNSFLNTVPTQVLSFDVYPIREDDGNLYVYSLYYENLEIISAAAKAKNIPFWAFALSTAHGIYPVPTLAQLRFQVYSNLAYGAQGIQYFTYWLPSDGSNDYHDAPIDADGNRTATWYLVQSMNAEIKGLSKVFLGASVVSVGAYRQQHSNRYDTVYCQCADSESDDIRQRWSSGFHS